MTDAAPPSVSVLIAVHNGLPYVESAVRSIIEQSLRDIEIVIVDDASTDETPAVLARLAAEDPRIRIETLAQNRRLPGALNRGLELVRGAYVARMDADDLAYPDRLAVQKTYLDRHPDVALVSTSVRMITSSGKVIVDRSAALDTFAMRWLSRFIMPLWHPTFMYRRTLPDGTPVAYDPAWTVSEDYDLIDRISLAGGVACLPQVLLDYRVHKGSITGSMTPKQKGEGRAMADRFRRADLPEDIVAQIAPFHDLHYNREVPDAPTMRQLLSGLRRMIAHDAQERPDLKVWMRRQVAVLLITSLNDAGLSRRDTLLLLLRHGPDFGLAGAMRLLESRRKLPKALQCRPTV